MKGENKKIEERDTKLANKVIKKSELNYSRKKDQPLKNKKGVGSDKIPSNINHNTSSQSKEKNFENEKLTKIKKDIKEIKKPKTTRKRVVKKVNEVLDKTNEKINKNVTNSGNKKTSLEDKTSKSGWWSRKSS